MKIFNCDNCAHPVFFENTHCVHCGSTLAFLAAEMDMGSIEPVPGSDSLWRHLQGDGQSAADGDDQLQDDGPRYRLCANSIQYEACNFAVEESDLNMLCVSCRQTRILPDLSAPNNLTRWYRIEIAKRRLNYTLARLGLISTKIDPVSGEGKWEAPIYEFKEDLPGGPAVMTGHDNGLITLNVAEADDDERLKRRLQLHEPYRTLLGHLRHESGHFYWDQLIKDTEKVQPFRDVFGDETLDYGQALQAHYAKDPLSDDWKAQYISFYAASHPWEDWAETWAHYLHMVDLLETASAYRTQVQIPTGEKARSRRRSGKVSDPFEGRVHDFDDLVSQWIPLTLLVNSLNRSLGQEDAYPFALTDSALKKLRFVHEVIYSQVLTRASEVETSNDETQSVVDQAAQNGVTGDAGLDLVEPVPAAAP